MQACGFPRSEKKHVPASPVCKFLGVVTDFRRLVTEGVVRVYVDEERRVLVAEGDGHGRGAGGGVVPRLAHDPVAPGSPVLCRGPRALAAALQDEAGARAAGRGRVGEVLEAHVFRVDVV